MITTASRFILAQTCRGMRFKNAIIMHAEEAFVLQDVFFPPSHLKLKIKNGHNTFPSSVKNI